MNTPPLSASLLDQRLNQIYDHLYANGPSRTPAGISYEITKLLRTLLFIEQSKNKDFRKIDDLRLTSKLPSKVSPEYITIIVNNINKAFLEMNTKYNFYSVSEKTKLSNFDLYYIYSKLSGVLISDPNKDVFGDAMEVFRSNWAKSHGGQFFTDQKVTDLAMTLLQFNPLKGDDLVDICAGSGGFLLAGLNHLRNLLREEKSLENEKVIEELAKKSIKGQEIDKEVCDVANTTLSSRIGVKQLHLVSEGNSILPDAFAGNNNSNIKYDSHLCVATNPPFGTKITIKDPSILSKYELAHTYNKKQSQQQQLLNVGRISPRAPDVLFLEQNIKLLKPGKGKLAIVIPFQIASGPQTYFIREWLLKNTQILAIVDLPSETFQPYTGTKTSLLLVKRRQTPLNKVDLSNDPRIFMSVPKWIGHDRRGNPTYKRLIDGSVSEEILTDFPDVEDSFKAFLEGGDTSKVYGESFDIPATNILLNADCRIDAQYHKSHQEIGNSFSHSTLNGKWKLMKIKNLVHKIFYPGRFTRNYVDGTDNSIPFLGGTNITQLLLITEKRLSSSNPKLEELCVEPGWILVTRSGSTGIVSSVPPAWKGFAISEHVIRIIPDNNKLSGEYLYAYLKSKYGQERLSQGVYGSVIDEITPDFIGDIEIPVPTSNDKLSNVIELVKKGEIARQNAIESLNKAVEDIEAEISLY